MYRRGKSAVGEISARGNVQSEKCPLGEIAARANVWSGKCRSAMCQSGKCPDPVINMS